MISNARSACLLCYLVIHLTLQNLELTHHKVKISAPKFDMHVIAGLFSKEDEWVSSFIMYTSHNEIMVFVPLDILL